MFAKFLVAPCFLVFCASTSALGQSNSPAASANSNNTELCSALNSEKIWDVIGLARRNLNFLHGSPSFKKGFSDTPMVIGENFEKLPGREIKYPLLNKSLLAGYDCAIVTASQSTPIYRYQVKMRCDTQPGIHLQTANACKEKLELRKRMGSKNASWTYYDANEKRMTRFSIYSFKPEFEGKGSITFEWLMTGG